MKDEYDVIVVGSGPGGATVAREMALRKKKVLLVERGGRMDLVGNNVSSVLMAKDFGLTFSREKNWVVCINNYGGSSVVAAGCAVPPPKIVFGPFDIDLSDEAAEAREDMWIGKLSDELVGEANLRLIDAANDLGYNWDKMEKFIDQEKCEPDCPDCMLGCKRGAKWTARVYGDEAKANGADVSLHTRIDRVITEGGRAIGVEGKRWGRAVKYYGKVVVLSAAMGSPVILKNSGIGEAGRGFAIDYLQFVGGIVPGMNTHRANPMSVGTLEHYESDGLILIPLFPGWGAFAIELLMMGPRYLPKFRNFNKYSGIMVKIRDDVRGEIFSDRDFSKPISKNDRKKLKKGVGIMKRILRKLGATTDSIIELPPMGAHPSATCRIGEVVDKNLETSISNLYVCDSSVFPTSLGLPVVWTVVSLGKRLSKHIDKRI